MTLDDLAALTGVGRSTIYYIDADDNKEAKNSTMKAIMHATNKKFGEPLLPHHYLSDWLS